MINVDSHDILQALFRWVHILAGVTWIGLLYFFNFVNIHVQNALEDRVRKKDRIVRAVARLLPPEESDAHALRSSFL